MSKVEEVITQLRALIDRRHFADGRLPSEPELARMMGSSRATVRQALATLELDGLIARKHGSGTFVNAHIQGIRTRLDEVYDFDEMIQQAGYEAGVRHLELQLGEAPHEVAERLSLDSGAEVLTTANVFLADGIPVIYCEDFLPAGLVSSAYRLEELHGPVYTFLAHRCSEIVDYNLSDIRPVVADAVMSGLLDCEIGSPLHYFQEIGFNADHKPIIYSKEYYRPEFFDFKVVRKMMTQFQAKSP